MYDLILTDNCFDPNGYWTKPIAKLLYVPTISDIDLFDQNGYDLTEIEKHYASSNNTLASSHRSHRTAIKKSWFKQESKIEGAVLNHSLLFERKSFKGEALDRLKYWARENPLIYKIISIRPKWGLDFSMDYVDRNNNVFEILHWEYDGFDHNEIQHIKEEIEPILYSIDWDDAGKKILDHKEDWYHLDFFSQSDWKCNYFGVPKEKFKMVCWK